MGALKKPPGSTWADLVANGPPISISTWWMLSVRHPRWILGRLAVLATEKEVPPGQVEAFAPTAIALPNLVTYSSEFCQQFKPPGQSTWANSTSAYRFEEGYLWNPTQPGRSIPPSMIFLTHSHYHVI